MTPAVNNKAAADWAKTVIPALLLALFARTYVAQAYNIPSGSMENTLLIGDHVLVEKISRLMGPPRRGEIVVFKSHIEDKILIKRVIGLPGETIALRAGVVNINGVPLAEPYLHPGDFAAPSGAPRDFGPAKVPEGNVFVMGDHRDNSLDSRMFGPVALALIQGRALAIHWSWRDEGYAVRWNRVGKALD
jgi:signal peptidase I